MSGIELTPELKERIKKNRERALAIQEERKRKLEKKHEEQAGIQVDSTDQQKKPKTSEDCEDWEIDASEWITKKEAMTKYCLPEGTLAVCEVSMKDNPHNKGWAPMKLFRRSEVRSRAYLRHGGKQGLVKERARRETKKLEKDLEKAEDIFG